MPFEVDLVTVAFRVLVASATAWLTSLELRWTVLGPDLSVDSCFFVRLFVVSRTVGRTGLCGPKALDCISFIFKASSVLEVSKKR